MHEVRLRMEDGLWNAIRMDAKAARRAVSDQILVYLEEKYPKAKLNGRDNYWDVERNRGILASDPAWLPLDQRGDFAPYMPG